ncbi:hypothetical protein N2152v2_005833 [Parachlorella kessleri]
MKRGTEPSCEASPATGVLSLPVCATEAAAVGSPVLTQATTTGHSHGQQQQLAGGLGNGRRRQQAGKGAAGSGRQLTQMHLDVGQRDFHLSKCAVCGLLYAKGEESDEKTHAAYHTSVFKGVRYQALPGERQLLADATGRLVVVPSSSSRSRKELSGFLEEQMGLVKGWLLDAPVSLYLYVSPTKRVLGCVVAEGIKEAFPVIPQLGAAALAQLRSHGSAAREVNSCPGQCVSPTAGIAAQAAAVGTKQVTLPAASLVFSSRSPQGKSAGAAAGNGRQVEAEAGVGGCSPGPAEARHGRQGGSGTVSGADRSADSSPQGCQGQQGVTVQQQREHRQLLHQCDTATSPSLELPPELPPREPSPALAHCPQQEHDQQGQHQAVLSAPCAVAAAAAAAPGLQPLMIDHTQRRRAVCGIRLVWVSLEARRKGVATRLLDCVRSHFVRGYVVPRHELAFTQPSDQGKALIEAYTCTRRFLVY